MAAIVTSPNARCSEFEWRFPSLMACAAEQANRLWLPSPRFGERGWGWSGARVFDWRRWERFGSKKLSQSGIGFLRPINQPPESDSHGSIAYQIQSKNRRSKTNCKFDKSKSAASTKACRAICGVPNRDATDSTSQFSNQSHDNGTHGDESTTCSGK